MNNVLGFYFINNSKIVKNLPVNTGDKELPFAV